jgi:cytochrome oxidase Cu insertion factor (SCO1/SenC/PrrC family)
MPAGTTVRRATAVSAAGWLLALLALLHAGPAAARSVQDLSAELRLVPLDRQPAPPFTLRALDGRQISLADLRGQVVLLYFWASW